MIRKSSHYWEYSVVTCNSPTTYSIISQKIFSIKLVLLGNLSPSSDCHICFVLSFIEVNLLRWIYLVTRYHIPWKTNWRYLVYILPSTYLHTRKALNCSPQQRTTLWQMSRGDEINVSHKNAWQHQIGYPIYETAARGLWRK